MTKSRKWKAWLNLTPPKPDDLHVIGEIQVPNPGVRPSLLVKESQGAGKDVLQLNLFLSQQAGVWPDVVSWSSAKYDDIVGTSEVPPRKVQVFSDKKKIAELDVDVIGASVRVEFKLETSGTAEVFINSTSNRLVFKKGKASGVLPKGEPFHLLWRLSGSGSKITIKYKPEGGQEKKAVEYKLKIGESGKGDIKRVNL